MLRTAASRWLSASGIGSGRLWGGSSSSGTSVAAAAASTPTASASTASAPSTSSSHHHHQRPRSITSSAHAAAAAAAAQVVANTEAERAIAEKIAGGLSGASSVRVEDTSGGCGTMYAIEVVASEFGGQSKIKQHQLVAKLISEDVKQWHGFQLVTKTP